MSAELHLEAYRHSNSPSRGNAALGTDAPLRGTPPFASRFSAPCGQEGLGHTLPRDRVCRDGESIAPHIPTTTKSHLPNRVQRQQIRLGQVEPSSCLQQYPENIDDTNRISQNQFATVVLE